MACCRDRRALEPEERAGSSAEDAVEPASFTRRRFLKVVAGAGVVTGVLGLGALSGLGIVYRPPEPPPPWEIAPGVVEHTKVPEECWAARHRTSSRSHNGTTTGRARSRRTSRIIWPGRATT